MQWPKTENADNTDKAKYNFSEKAFCLKHEMGVRILVIIKHVLHVILCMNMNRMYCIEMAGFKGKNNNKRGFKTL